MREKVWFIEQEVRIGNLSESEATDQILSLLKEEIKKSLLTDEEIRDLDYSYSGEFKNSREVDEWVKQVVAQAQVNNTLKIVEGDVKG